MRPVIARLGLAAFETEDVLTVTGRAPTTLAAFARRERATWAPHLDVTP